MLIGSLFHSTHLHIAGPCPFLYNHLCSHPPWRFPCPVGCLCNAWSWLSSSLILIFPPCMMHLHPHQNVLVITNLVKPTFLCLACYFCNPYQTQKKPVDELKQLTWATATISSKVSRAPGHSRQGQGGISMMHPSERWWATYSWEEHEGCTCVIRSSWPSLFLFPLGSSSVKSPLNTPVHAYNDKKVSRRSSFVFRMLLPKVFENHQI